LNFEEESEVALSTDLTLESKWSQSTISSGNSLTELLEKLVTRAHTLLNAESTVLHLFDASGGSIKSSFVVGQPLLEDSNGRGYKPNAVRSAKFGQRAEEELFFAGERLGILLVKLRQGEVFNAPMMHGLRALALQGVMALVNARYTQELLKQKRGSNLDIEVRTGFLGTLSHEVRGPLGIILNASELVLEGLCGPLTEDQVETLSMVKSNTSHLMELIGDVLDFAKLESGRMSPTLETLSVNEQLAEITKMVRANADSKEHSLKLRESATGLFIRCDRRHFRQILLNLLTNAIKYTPDRGEVDVWSEVGTKGGVRICVRDSGVGIPDNQRSKVFAPFERIDHEYSSAQQGTGLGLSLTKRLAEVNGGEINFDSVPGYGTTFWVEFPASDQTRQTFAQPSVRVGPARNSGDNILIVGPGDEERVLVTRYLKNLGYEVHLAEGVGDAQPILRSKKIGLVLLGTGFVPSGQGPLGSFVRNEQGSRYIPVVLLTRSAFLVDVERYLLEDVDRCLSKPVKLEEIALACQSALEATRT
jgi:signal transduction histidine kinase/CheY-like chemotaxis protein